MKIGYTVNGNDCLFSDAHVIICIDNHPSIQIYFSIQFRLSCIAHLFVNTTFSSNNAINRGMNRHRKESELFMKYENYQSTPPFFNRHKMFFKWIVFLFLLGIVLAAGSGRDRWSKKQVELLPSLFTGRLTFTTKSCIRSAKLSPAWNLTDMKT